ncbi:MAG: VOC family protein [Cellvibrionaceae bacterium]
MSEYLGAVGIAVSDLDRSVKFYTDVLGLSALQTINLKHMNEVVMGFKGTRSASVVLMNYIDDSNPNCSNNPVKLVFYKNDAKATIAAIGSAGYDIVSEPKPYESMGNILIGFGKDPDGYLIEVIQKPAKN